MKDELIKRLKDNLVAGGLDTLDPEKVKDIKTSVSEELSVPDFKYRCTTQASMPMRTANLDPASIWVGLFGKIPRWKKGVTVNFAAYAGGYPTPNHAIFAAYRLWEAAKIWNNLNVGVQFKWVGKLEDAAFVLAYGGDGGTTLARAFFPNADNLNTLFVYKKAFEPGFINYMVNVFLHELGHVLGLRHEFADQEGGAVQWGPRNPLSVMSYNFPPQIQPSDIRDTKSFYNFTGTKIGSYTIQDWFPDN